MHILVTNDDGIHAPGLWALAEAMLPLGQVTVVAPDREQSGVGTAMSLGRHLHAHRIRGPLDDVPAWAVEGSPGDAVLLASQALAGSPLDAVVSGINLGANVGNDTVISGTVGAALQGFFQGHFAVAVSLAAVRDPDWAPAAWLAARLVEARARDALPRDLFLNVNLPPGGFEAVRGIHVLPAAETSAVDAVEEHVDRKGQAGYMIVRQGLPESQPGTDVWGLRQGYAVLTPLRRALAGDARWQALEALAQDLWAGMAWGEAAAARETGR